MTYCSSDFYHKTKVLATARMALKRQAVVGLTQAPCLRALLSHLPVILQEQHTYEKVPYLTLPSGEDVLPPSVEASNGPNAHPQINLKVTKSPSVVLTWVHTNNGTIPPLCK